MSPIGSICAVIVMRESVRIYFTNVALNELEVFVADIRNDYPQALSSKKNFIICGTEIGLKNIGKRVLIKRSECDDKSS